jgi:hypothetical protein
MELEENEETKDARVFQDLQVRLELLVHKDLLVYQALKDHLEDLDLQVTRALMACLEWQWDKQDSI